MTTLNFTCGINKEESKNLFFDSNSIVQLIKTLHHEHLSQVTSLEQEEEYQYHVQSQIESIARFKKRHPNGAKIDVNATVD